MSPFETFALWFGIISGAIGIAAVIQQFGVEKVIKTTVGVFGLCVAIVLLIAIIRVLPSHSEDRGENERKAIPTEASLKGGEEKPPLEPPPQIKQTPSITESVRLDGNPQVYLCADCQHFLVAHRGDSLAKWSLESKKKVNRFTQKDQRLASLVVTPDARQAVSIHTDTYESTLRVWDVGTWKVERSTVWKQENPDPFIAVSPNAIVVVEKTGWSDARVWNASERKWSGRLEPNKRCFEHASTLHVVSDSRIVALLDHDHSASAHVWDKRGAWEYVSKDFRLSLDDRGERARPAISLNGLVGVFGGTRKGFHCFSVVDLSSWEEKTVFPRREDAHPHHIRLLALSPKGELLASVCETHVRVWDIESRELIDSYEFDGDPRSVAFSPCGTHTICCTYLGSMLKTNV